MLSYFQVKEDVVCSNPSIFFIRSYIFINIYQSYPICADLSAPRVSSFCGPWWMVYFVPVLI
jgi:hypothetical protein